MCARCCDTGGEGELSIVCCGHCASDADATKLHQDPAKPKATTSAASEDAEIDSLLSSLGDLGVGREVSSGKKTKARSKKEKVKDRDGAIEGAQTAQKRPGEMYCHNCGLASTLVKADIALSNAKEKLSAIEQVYVNIALHSDCSYRGSLFWHRAR